MARDLSDVLHDFHDLYLELVMLVGTPFNAERAAVLMDRHKKLRLELKESYWAARRKGIDLRGLELPYSVY